MEIDILKKLTYRVGIRTLYDKLLEKLELRCQASKHQFTPFQVEVMKEFLYSNTLEVFENMEYLIKKQKILTHDILTKVMLPQPSL